MNEMNDIVGFPYSCSPLSLVFRHCLSCITQTYIIMAEVPSILDGKYLSVKSRRDKKIVAK